MKHGSLKYKRFRFYRYLPVLVATIAVLLMSDDGRTQEETQVPAAVAGSLDYLLGLVQPETEIVMDWARVAGLVEFIRTSKSEGERWHAGSRSGAPSSYYEFELQTDLGKILEYGYNPDLPAGLLSPSSLRWAHWIEVQGHPRIPALWEQLPLNGPPVVVRGTELTELTPDLTTGTYYRYSEHRTLIFGQIDGRKILISISKQVDTSDVGRRGIVLGERGDWNYLYSDRAGLSQPIPCDLSTYIYDSFGATVFTELEPGRPGVRCGMFRWLRAGWGWVNMVRPQHIHNGQQRYAADFKSILEHPQLPPAGDLARRFARLQKHSDKELRSEARLYLQRLRHQFKDSDSADGTWLDLLHSEDYLQRLSRRDMNAMLMLEDMKTILGKTGRGQKQFGMLDPTFRRCDLGVSARRQANRPSSGTQ